jgi:branched-chain amino acid transport system permease protein
MSLTDSQPESPLPDMLEPPPRRLKAVLFLLRSSRWIQGGLLVIFLIFALLGPSYLGTYGLTLAFTLFNYMTLAQSWNLVGGYGGQFSLGHSLFVGVGSYTVAVLIIHTNIPLYLAIPLSGLMAACIALVAALLLMRLREAYFSIGSLGLTMAGLTWMINWPYTGQASGLNLPPTVTLDYSTLYYLSLVLLIMTVTCIALLVRSPFGLRLMAIRDDEDAAAELGVYSFPVKLTAFAISAFFIGVVGALIALNSLNIEPNSAFSMDWVTTMIIITVIGGISTLTGPLIGAIVIFALQQLLQGYENLSALLIGLLLILIIRLVPDGIWTTLRIGILRLVEIMLKQRSTRQQKKNVG